MRACNFDLSLSLRFRFRFDWCLDIYWKNEHRLMCTGEVCTAAERDRYEKSVIDSGNLFLFLNFDSIVLEFFLEFEINVMF